MKPGTGQETTSWKPLYEAAVLELDDTKFLERILEAQHAIMDRLEDLDHAGDTIEGQELSNALLVLGDLRRIESRRHTLPKAA